MTNREFLVKSVTDKSNDEKTALWMCLISLLDIDWLYRLIDKDTIKGTMEALDKEMKDYE